MIAKNAPDRVRVTFEFDWKLLGDIEWQPNGRLQYPKATELAAAGTYRIHAGGWPLQGDEFDECWYVGMSTTCMRDRIVRHMRERGRPHERGAKPFRWILENGGWVRLWTASKLSLNEVDEEFINQPLVGRGFEAAGIVSNLSYMGRWNRQL